MRQIRLLPIVVFAATALLVLKTGGLIYRGGFLFAETSVAQAQTAEEAATAGAKEAQPADAAGKDEAKGTMETAAAGDGGRKGGAGETGQAGRSVNPGKDVVGAKAAILGRLGERRKELDARERQLELRENLLKATEKRVEERITLLQQIEQRIVAVEKKREAEKSAQFKGLTTMYESMKPKDAARIFNALEIDILVELVEQMNARKMAEVLANMDSDAAERLTMAIAARGRAKAAPVDTAELPKIEGKKID